MGPRTSVGILLNTIEDWMAKARDGEVTALAHLVQAEQDRRGLRPSPGTPAP